MTVYMFPDSYQDTNTSCLFELSSQANAQFTPKPNFFSSKIMNIRALTPLTNKDINTKRLNNLTFEHEGHKYKYKGRETKISTTGFIKQFFNEFDADGIITNFMSKPGSRSEVTYRGMSTEEIKKQWDDNGTIASGKGTILHEMIEFVYTLGFMPGWKTFSQVKDYCELRLADYDEMTDKLNKHIEHDESRLTEPEPKLDEPDIKTIKRWYDVLAHESYDPTFDQKTGWENFMKFESMLQDEDIYEPVMPEVKIHTKEQISGMVDMLYRNKKTGNYLVCDWKRCKDLKKRIGNKKGHGPCKDYYDTKLSHYRLQITFYAMTLNKYYNIRVTEAWIVGLHPNKDEPEIIPVDITKYALTVENMLAKTNCTVYLPVMNYTDINFVERGEEGMRRYTYIVRLKSSLDGTTMLTHKADAYGFQAFTHYVENTPIYDLPCEITIPYLCNHTEKWTKDKQDIYDEGYPLNITFKFVKTDE